MPDYLLDTSFLIAYFNKVADEAVGPARQFRSTMPARARLFASIAALAELVEGAEDAGAVERELCRLTRLVGPHHQHAIRAGRMQRRARASGSPMGENDARIAATAAMAQLVVAGDDDKAFAKRPSVAYVNFHKAAN